MHPASGAVCAWRPWCDRYAVAAGSDGRQLSEHRPIDQEDSSECRRVNCYNIPASRWSTLAPGYVGGERFPDRSKLAQLIVTETGKLRDVARERQCRVDDDAETSDTGRQRNDATAERNDREGDFDNPSTWSQPHDFCLGGVKFQSVARHRSLYCLYAPDETSIERIDIGLETVLIELEIVRIAVYAKPVLKGDVEHVWNVEQIENGEDRALRNAAHNSWRDGDRAVVTGALSSPIQVRANPAWRMLQYAERDLGTTQEDLMIDAIESRAEVEKTQKCQHTDIRRRDSIRWNL